MSDIEQRLENLRSGSEGPPGPFREGLPSAYRMRADSHYVEQLDSLPASTLTLLEPKAIEIRGDAPQPAADFVESIKRHGVLQPLLVQTRGGRYRLIAGRKRLTAAIAAGLQEVPCVLQRVDEEQARELAEATNLPSLDAPAATRVETGASSIDTAAESLAQSLSALASSANLLSGGSQLAQTVAASLVKAEASRALQLLLASRVLRGDIAIARARVPVKALIDRALQVTAAERHLRAIDVRISDGARDSHVRGDEELLGGALASLVTVTIAFLGDLRGPVVLATSGRPDGRVSVSVSQDSLTVPDAWIAQAFDASWPMATASASTLVLMQSSRRIAEGHGGQAVASSTETGTSFSLVLPLVLREM
jgi:ParB/RepB/Spo0J family partition protein